MRYPDRPPAPLASTSWQTRGPRSAATRCASWAPRGRGVSLAYLVTCARHRSPRPGAGRSALTRLFGGLERRRLRLVQARPKSGLTRRERRRAAPPAAGVVAGGRLRVPARGGAVAARLPGGGVRGLRPGAPADRPVAGHGRHHGHVRLAHRPRRRGLARRARSAWSRWCPWRTSSRWPRRPRRHRPGCCSTRARRELAAEVADLRRSRVGPGRRLRDRAPPDRARPARRRPAAAGRPHHDAGAGGARRTRRARGWPPCRTPTARPRRRWPSCAAPSAASTRGCWSTTGWPPRCTSWPTGRRCPSTVDIRLPERLPPPVEQAAYFVVSEALTNVARHARARRAGVHAWLARRHARADDRGRRRGRRHRRRRRHRAGRAGASGSRRWVARCRSPARPAARRR